MSEHEVVVTNKQNLPVLRSALFAPATRADLLRKLPRSQPDAAIFDLEDGVPPDAKEAARGIARSAAKELATTVPRLRLFMRINAVGTPWFAEDIVQALVSELTGIVLPKYESLDQLAQVYEMLKQQGLAHLSILVGLETTLGIARVEQILRPPIVAAYFGAEDFIADMGGERTEAGLEVLYARSRVVLAARVAGIQALDQVVVNFHDDHRFVTEAAQARALGYTGKLCIHPAQVPLAHQAFNPTPQEVERAHRLLDAYQHAQAEQQGVFVFEGQMIDLPLVRRAESILDRVKHPAVIEKEEEQ
ncbi:MAG: CoA ester lyase [Ktedonobacteraceae bacterium]